jgi:pimeloyl-ACP methyl ester carboxylesterase
MKSTQTSSSSTAPKGNTQDIYPVPKAIVWLGRLLQFFSKDLAARYSRYFFMRPMRHKMKPAEKKWMDEAEQTVIDVPSIGKKIHVYRWGPKDAPKVLLAHGWSGRGTQFIDLGRRLLEEGYQVYAFDAPAHGQSGTGRTLMLDFIESIREMDRRFGPFEAIIGHSMGGIAALNAVGRFGLKPGKLITIGIPDSIKKIFYDFAEIMGLKPVIAEKNIDYLATVYGTDIDHLAGSYNAALTDIPVLVVHDKKDKEVPYTEAEAIVEELKNGRLLLTEGFGHRRILRNPYVIDQIVRFIREGDINEEA